MKKSIECLRTWIEVDTKALARNYRAFRKLIGPKVKLMSVVKSNAYGHGLIDFSKLMVELGVDWLGVDSIVEAVALRRAGIKKNILVLGYTRPINFPLALQHHIVVTISSLESLQKLLEMSRPPQLQLKIDTGMHRQGFILSDLAKALDLLGQPQARLVRSQIVGVYSHLAAASSQVHASATNHQLSTFEKALEMLEQAGFSRESLIKHLAATGGVIAYSKARYDLVRVGLGMYGLWPSLEWKQKFESKIKLGSALTWETIISEIKILDSGGGVGYNFIEQVKSRTKLAVCPIGYWHGYPRILSSLGEVLVRKVRAKVVGRVSMDMIVIDVTFVRGIKVGDVVTLIGEKIPAERLATFAHTSPYEIITRLNPLIQKFYR